MGSSQADLSRRIRRWIVRGGTPPVDPEQLAEQADLLLRKELSASTRRALTLAAGLRERGRKAGAVGLMYVALRAEARSEHVGGNHRRALRRYRAARRMAEGLADRLGAARIDRALADVYMYLNRYDDAQMAARRAVRAFRRLGAEEDAVQSQVNLANLLHRQDRHADAERIYAAAEDFFSRRDNPVAKARVAYNRGNTLVQLFRWEQAAASYRRALELYEAQELALDANDARYGLAYLLLLSDRFAEALGRLTECARLYRAGGDPRGAALCDLDMAEAYLGMNLFREGRLQAEAARAQFSRLRLRYERGKATLYLAWALAGLGDPALASRRARAAQAMFEREQNRGMAAAAGLLRASLKRDRAARKRALMGVRRAFRQAQLPVWSTLCDLQILAQPGSSTEALSRLARNPAVRRVPHWSAWYDTLCGDRARQAGQTAKARQYWQKAALTLERARAHLPPLELRAAYLAGRTDPYRRLVALEAGRNPRAAAEWAERLKTAGLWMLADIQGPAGDEGRSLQEEWRRLTAQLAALARKLDTPAGPGRSGASPRAERTMRMLEQRCQRTLAQIEAQRLTFGGGEDVQAEIDRLSQRMPLVIWHCSGADLYAFVLRGRDAQTHIWPDGVSRLAMEQSRWRFLLERHMLTGAGVQQGPPQDAELVFWSEVGEWLFKPLDLQEVDGTTILVVPEGPLFALPFAALRLDGAWLGDRFRFVVQPSLRHYGAARARARTVSEIQIFEAADDSLPAVRHEVQTLTGLLEGRPYTLHRQATREQLLSGPAARLWHFAGHARFRSDNPFYSALLLKDGPVFAADLRVRRAQIDLATLSACHSGGGAAAPGEEYSGLVRSILEMGARSVVAGLWPVADASTAVWMSEFYRNWLGGTSLAEAVQSAQVHTRARWSSPYHWAAFALFGVEA